jgi:hypothetical protein
VVNTADGPRVRSVARFGVHRQPTLLVVAFDEALDQVSAESLANYRLVARGRDGRFGTRDDVAIPILSAAYDPATRCVKLKPSRLLPVRQQFRLTLNGSLPPAITDLSGNPLDGEGTGRPGSDHVTTLSMANLVRNRLAPLPPSFTHHDLTPLIMRPWGKVGLKARPRPAQ